MKAKFKECLSQLGGYFFLAVLSFVLFFTASFLVFSFRSSHSQYIEMPNVLGKNYIQVHNYLSKLHFKVEIETKNFPDKENGVILSQSISPGKKVKFDTKILLIVNQAASHIEVPDLVGQSVEKAKKILNQRFDKMIKIGGINYIHSDQEPSNIILKQIPEAGKKMNQNQKIYFLVSQEKKVSFDLKTLENKPYPFVHKVLQDLEKDFKIQKIESIYKTEKNGLVTNISEEPNGSIQMEVSIKEAFRRNKSGYEKFQYKIKETGSYKIILENIENKKKESLFEHKPFYKGELLNMIFYRQGNIILSLFDSNGLVKEKKYLTEL